MCSSVAERPTQHFPMWGKVLMWDDDQWGPDNFLTKNSRNRNHWHKYVSLFHCCLSADRDRVRKGCKSADLEAQFGCGRALVATRDQTSRVATAHALSAWSRKRQTRTWIFNFNTITVRDKVSHNQASRWLSMQVVSTSTVDPSS